MKLEVVEPCWLIAVGDAERVEVLRSPLVTLDDPSYEPIDRFITDHGLVLAVQETWPDPEFMFGQVEASVYVPPSVRNGVLASTEMSLSWYAAAELVAAE
ncbi:MULTISPECIES: hypothetical protein [unclassified Mycolicibacterium]|uniref:hypothetical protein n=1 Tax=unclassified Mycolicibacterium TaxID=2636767 RepID=UPI0012DF989F|nr:MULTISPECIES: hypothetical protein [unclassified Mycolicibacterium]MUL85036.1 hypothetical protein [Mycolicibacterium sp. CBMA 329]MUL91003.1 hypothetical protein [Mycolicibacterium sp. CBMA 331]MUM29065.1 hypothetical protein [Mycolicibacterium sp. CBMA 295]MUM40762.1 hypothetical protein [Mycolicibacterium sp. CBMA 247]MUM46958.1 hypothetical protein [Mycolicibacterium sp. CBMA 294]